MHCAIWYHLFNLKNVKTTHGGVLLLVKLQASYFPNGEGQYTFLGENITFILD